MARIPKGRFYWKEMLAICCIFAGFYFFRQERHELSTISDTLQQISWPALIAGLASTVLYIGLMALTYVFSFKAVGANVSFASSLELFLKRNFIGVFLPMGGITSQTFFSGIIERKGIPTYRVNFASAIFLIVGILSVFIVGIPVLAWLGFTATAHSALFIKLLYSFPVLILITWGTVSFLRKKWLYQRCKKWFPAAFVAIDEMMAEGLSKKYLWIALLMAVLIEVIGITQLYIAITAVEPGASLLAAVLGYTVAVILLIASPLLKGIGAIELAVTFILTEYGFGTASAAAIVILFRFYNFWLMMLAGIVSFVWSRQNVLLRVFPAGMIFILGIVNLVSALSPAIKWRMIALKSYLPLTTIHASNDLTLFAGVVLLFTATYLVKGSKTAWYVAVITTMVSLVGHLFKDIDYEEAIYATIVLIALLITRSQYKIKNDPGRRTMGIRTSIGVFVVALVMGVLGFYFLDKKHFGIDFNFMQSVQFTLQQFFLLSNDTLVPLTKFGEGYLRLISFMGIGAFSFLLYTLGRPYIFDEDTDQSDLSAAREIAQQYSVSSLDYFKIYPDKLIFFNEKRTGFISYKIANGFAVVLGMPVCENTAAAKKEILTAFEQFCKECGLHSAYYRVREADIIQLQSFKKKFFVIGQEATIVIDNFSLEGKKKQNLRTARNTLTKKGYTMQTFEPPLSNDTLQQMEAVSKDWLGEGEKRELVFSQGMFDKDIMRNHTVIALMSPAGVMAAFVELVPVFRNSEVRYDLLRKRNNEQNGTTEWLLLAVIDYCKSKQIAELNMGMAPMAGIEEPKSMQERSIKLAYEKIKRFRHYKGLRNFKERFDPSWENVYFAYESSYDLFFLPSALNQVMRDDES